MFVSLFVYLFLGMFAGFVAGLFGVGGGLILVPALLWLFLHQGMPEAVVMHLALGTSLATIVITALSSTWAHHRQGAVIWPWLKWLAPGLIVGAFVGALIADSLSTAHLQWLFGVFELGVALYLLLGVPAPQRDGLGHVPRFECVTVAGLIGALSSLFGIGGGTLTVPYLSWRGLVMARAVAVSAACGVPIAVAGSVAYIITGWDDATLPPWSMGYLYWPAFLAIIPASLVFAPLGAKVAHYLPAPILRYLFVGMMLLMGGLMIGLS